MAAASSSQHVSVRAATPDILISTYNIGALDPNYCMSKAKNSSFRGKLEEDLTELLEVCCKRPLVGLRRHHDKLARLLPCLLCFVLHCLSLLCFAVFALFVSLCSALSACSLACSRARVPSACLAAAASRGVGKTWGLLQHRWVMRLASACRKSIQFGPNSSGRVLLAVPQRQRLNVSRCIT